MQLNSFRVTDFRSIKDTDWIEASIVTALIGTNESGKSNILLALWKLKPAREGEIDLLADIPRAKYHILRDTDLQPVFIRARFELTKDQIECIANLTDTPADLCSEVEVSRRLDGARFVSFPNTTTMSCVQISSAKATIEDLERRIDRLEVAGKTEVPTKEQILESLSEAKSAYHTSERKLQYLSEIFGDVKHLTRLKNSEVLPAFDKFFPAVIANAVYDLVPPFVYYANYGNLDSEIYLPHVIEDMNREGLGSVKAAKTRTLRVLFEFVNLEPTEILELGRESGNEQEQIQLDARNKKEREILLQSASNSLTNEFRDWWRQGNHKFRFHADGNHFRIWVSDDIRPEEVELEGRSAGLQWFLSFFLVFLVECKTAHKDAILLLDEPGVSLHPIAQEDLFEFFETLSEDNQVFYTSHSPFMVNSDQLDRIRTVYYDEDGRDKGLTKVSADLRAKEKAKGQIDSIYPVHAALGISVSQALLAGSTQIIVEGTSDQYYLSAMKSYLIGHGLIQPERELLFMPTGGASGIKAVVPILAGKDGKPPIVVLDGDNPGKQTAKRLKKTQYEGHEDRIVLLSDVSCIAEAEIEDLIPTDIFAWAVNRSLGRFVFEANDDFTDFVTEKGLHVTQVEEYARKYDFDLRTGWKVDVAKRVKERIMENRDLVDKSSEIVRKWKDLFELFCNES